MGKKRFKHIDRRGVHSFDTLEGLEAYRQKVREEKEAAAIRLKEAQEASRQRMPAQSYLRRVEQLGNGFVAGEIEVDDYIRLADELEVPCELA